MQQLMLRFDTRVRRHRKLVLVAWVLVLAAAFPFAAKQSEHLSSGGFTVPGSQSVAVSDAVEKDFAKAERGTLAAVLVPKGGDLGKAYERLAAAVKAEPEVELATAKRPRLSEDRPTIVPFRLEVTDDDAADVAKGLRERLAIADGPREGVSTHLIGQGALWAGLQDISKEDLEKAETTGFPIVLLILLVVFGSLTAAALPLAVGVFSVLITGALIYFVSLSFEMSVFVTNMASMIGIGVAVDYSLFVLARYREEVRAGIEPDEARGRAMATSGLAVLFSGLTVMISLAGLWMIDNNAIRSMALGAILVVAVSLLASATLLPALIKVMGHRAYARSRFFTVSALVLRSRSRRRRGSTNPAMRRPGRFWDRWTAAVTKRPAVTAGLASIVLLVLAIPALSLETGGGALRQFPAGYETRVGFEAAAQVADPGASSQTRVLAPASEAERVTDVLRADPGIASVGRPLRSDDGEQVLIGAIPKFDAESKEAKATVVRLRDKLPQADVGGVSAAQKDVQDLISGSMWKLLLFVLGLSYLVLMVLLRSVVLPLKAVIMNLLSVGAAYGVLVAVFQWGWVDGFLGFQSNGYIDTLTPPLVLAVVFGLSMDYEVFLLSRIKERYDATGDTRRAVTEGLAASARTITSAALIMVAVFAVFVGTGVPSIKQLGLGNAVAIAVDATLVRLVLVPAAMELMGKWNWYLPGFLDRILPNTNFEELPSAHVAAEPAADRERAAALV